MTLAGLLGYILAGLLLQVFAAVAIALRHRRRTPAGAQTTEHSPAPRVSATAWKGWREFRVARREYEDRARTQCSFYLEPVDGAPLPRYLPGQYLTFSVPVTPDRTVNRCYSLSDQPFPTGYRITIKRMAAPKDRPDVPPGASSSHFLDQVQAGDVLKVKAPAGTFHIHTDSDVPVVLIAGGIGITPMMSIMQWCLAVQTSRIVHLYYGVRNSNDHAFKQTLEQLARSHPGLRLNIVYSKPGGEDQQGRDFHHAGHVDAGLLRRTLPHGRHQFYVCGPTAMMESLIPALSLWGVPAGDIFHEAFGPASLRPAHRADSLLNPGAEPHLEIQFRRSGRTLVWNGQDRNLLDFAERNAVAVESGCRTGSCGTCETKLVSGTVRYSSPPDHEVAAGCCMLCVGTPESALVLEA